MAGSNLSESVPSIDPYRNYTFRIAWDGRLVAGVSKAGGLIRITPQIRHRDSQSGIPPQTLAQSDYGAITLERGVTYDLEFESWANKVWDYSNTSNDLPPTQDDTLKNIRRDMTLQIYNQAGQFMFGYLIHKCWVSEFISLPSMEGNGNAVAIQKMTLENEGWDRVGPSTPTFQEQGQ